jgi:hypothetical protein
MADGTMSVFNQMADSIPALASTASSVTSCAIFMSCSGLASDLSSAAQAVSTADPAKIIDSAKHFVLDPFADMRQSTVATMPTAPCDRSQVPLESRFRSDKAGTWTCS